MKNKSLNDFFECLNLDKHYTLELLYKRKPKYVSFCIPKKNGKHREIEAPFPEIKKIQKSILLYLNEIYKPRFYVHGFCKYKGISTNANPHVGKKFIIHIDIENFFHSINFWRIRGILKSRMYNMDDEVATVVAHAACFNSRLPMGGVISPIISNILAGPLDVEMKRMAQEFRMTYTRYADDITFSTNLEIDSRFLRFDNISKTWSGIVVERIASNGFAVNQSKIYISNYRMRQEVTGVIVNKKKNVRKEFVDRIRGALHAWEKYGESCAQTRLRELTGNDTKNIRNYISGMLAHLYNVKGRDDNVFQRLMGRYQALCGNMYIVGDQWKFSGILIVYDCDKTEIGTAFISKEKLIITCAHVAKNAQYISSWIDHEKLCFCEIGKSCEDTDVATLNILGKFNINILNSYSIIDKQFSLQSEYIFAGFPNHITGSMPTVKSGKIASIITYMNHTHYKLDQDIHGGASGSPLFDSNMSVRGIVVRGLNDGYEKGETDSNLAVHIKYLLDIVR